MTKGASPVGTGYSSQRSRLGLNGRYDPSPCRRGAEPGKSDHGSDSRPQPRCNSTCFPWTCRSSVTPASEGSRGLPQALVRRRVVQQDACNPPLRPHRPGPWSTIASLAAVLRTLGTAVNRLSCNPPLRPHRPGPWSTIAPLAAVLRTLGTAVNRLSCNPPLRPHRPGPWSTIAPLAAVLRTLGTAVNRMSVSGLGALLARRSGVLHP